jgi:hypothetical protein
MWFKKFSFEQQRILIIKYRQNLCQKFMGAKLTSREKDYSKWYNEIVFNADLAENSAVADV